MEEKGYIYIIECVANGRVYIGSTMDIESRIKTHFSSLKSDRHMNRLLNKDYLEFGDVAFSHSVIERCVGSKLINREKIHIKGCKQPCYNVMSNPKRLQEHEGLPPVEGVIKTYGLRPFDNELIPKLSDHAKTLDRSLNWLIVKTLEQYHDKVTNPE